jgi:predicted  nucleic acid-binding Zn-ribbon protein
VTIDLETASRALTFILSAGAFLYTFLSGRRKDVEQKFKAGSDRMDRHEARILVTEQKISALPDKDDMHKLQIELTRMVGTLGQMQAVMEGNANIMERLENIVSRHEDFLLDGGKSR